jgi:hypothetical protein
VKRALPLFAFLALAGCGGSHEAKPKPKPKPQTPVLSALLARRGSVHFVLHGTVKIDEQSLLSHLHQVPPLHVHAVGDASRYGLTASGSVQGEVSGSSRVVVSGPKAFGLAEGRWYSMGKVKPAADLLRSANWTVDRAPDGTAQTLHGDLHASSDQLEQLSGVSVPFGVEGADATVTIHLSRWGEPVSIRRPGHAVPLPSG